MNEFIAIFGAHLDLTAASSSHPNELKFSGTLVRLDEASTKAPHGSQGHKILIPKALAIKKVKTLVGMGVNYDNDLDKHAPKKKVGVIKKAWVEGNAIKVSGVIWKKDFPDAETALKKPNLGMSFEAADISVEDMSAAIWRLSSLCFTGAAILYKNAAAYFKTEALAASASMSVKLIKKNDGGNSMANTTKKNKKSSIAASGSNNDKLVAALIKGQTQLISAVNALAASSSRTEQLLSASMAENIAAKAKKAANSDKADDEDDADDDEEDDDDDDMDSSEDVAAEGEEEDLEAEGEEVEAKGKKGKKAKAASDDDDDMDSSEDEEASADDEDEVDDLADQSDDNDSKPGKLNSKIKTGKGNKTSVTTVGEKHKNVKASALATISKQVDALVAAREADIETIKTLRRQLKASTKQIEAAGERTGRRSFASPPLTALLAKEGLDVGTLSASGEKFQASEMDAMFAKGNCSITQRIAMKAEAARLGVMDEGHITRR